MLSEWTDKALWPGWGPQCLMSLFIGHFTCPSPVLQRKKGLCPAFWESIRYWLESWLPHRRFSPGQKVLPLQCFQVETDSGLVPQISQKRRPTPVPLREPCYNLRQCAVLPFHPDSFLHLPAIVSAQVVFQSEISSLRFPLVNPDLTSRPSSRDTCSVGLLWPLPAPPLYFSFPLALGVSEHQTKVLAVCWENGFLCLLH